MSNPNGLSHAQRKRLERNAEWRRKGRPLNTGPFGLFELIRQWLRLPDEQRRKLLLVAREMAQGERNW